MIKEIGAFAGLAAFLGLAVLALLLFTQGRDIRRLREWAGSAPERDSERKESTSAVAAQRAEELRRLEEARTAEHEAATLRDERRRRREAGLPELTRKERLQQRFSGARMSEPLYLVAIFVVGLVAAGGIAYAVMGGIGGGDGGGGGKKQKQAATKPSEITVSVLNGTATTGLAAEYGNKLRDRNFQIGDVTNSSSRFEDSVVMFERGNAPEARRVARALDISEVRLMTADIEADSGGAPVSVIVGEDNASSTG